MEYASRTRELQRETMREPMTGGVHTRGREGADLRISTPEEVGTFVRQAGIVRVSGSSALQTKKAPHQGVRGALFTVCAASSAAPVARAFVLAEKHGPSATNCRQAVTLRRLNGTYAPDSGGPNDR